MKRTQLIQYLKANQCSLQYKGAKHLLFIHEVSKSRSTIPLKAEIKDLLCKKICKDIGVKSPV